MQSVQLRKRVLTLEEYNNSVYISQDVLTGKQYRRLRRKNL